MDIPRIFSRRTVLKVAGAALLATAVGKEYATLASGGSQADTALTSEPIPPLPLDVVKPVVAPKATAFDPAAVRLLPGPFLEAQTRDGQYLLFLNPDRLLHSFLQNAGLPPKANPYGGWEVQGVAGHIGGHYLSACAAMYRATGNTQFRQRADYMVSELARCQAQTPDGLITAIPDFRTIFAKVAATGEVTGWVPWYTMHKLFAGLRDTYRYCGNEQAKGVFLRLSDWALAETANLNDGQLARMLDVEHGGMAETAADAYAMTDEPKYLELVRRFTHHAIMDPLADGRDELDGKHSNTNIPKLVGYERVYQLTGHQPYHAASDFFWQTVVNSRSYANGGNGDQEHFFPVADFASHVDSVDTTETCCTYNMLKLTDLLFQADPTSKYADYAERASLNHILASQEPDHGMVCYFTPTKPGLFRVYNDPENAMWCCTGTGIENHARYGMSIYYYSPDAKTLYVNQYISSLLNWHETGLSLRMDSTLPDAHTAKLTVTTKQPQRLTIKLRKPFWATGASIAVNGKTVDSVAGSDGYFAVDRVWHGGDTIHITLPMSIRLEPLPNVPSKCAVMYGPVLLASPMGHDGMDTHPDIATDQNPYDNLPALNVPTFVGESEDFARKIIPVSGSPLTFKTDGIGNPSDVTLSPFFRLHHQRYNLYWSVYSPDEWKRVKAENEAEVKREAELDADTIDIFMPGNQQSEVDHKFQQTNSRTGIAFGRAWRDANDGSFAFSMKVDPTVAEQLTCTYWGGDAGKRAFDIMIDGSVIATQTLNNLAPGKFIDVSYDIPSSIVQGKSVVSVMFKSKPGEIAGGLFGCRMMKKKD